MNNNSQTGLYQSASSSTSTLRPRAPRLISYLDDDSNDIAAISTSSSSTPPRLPSRGASPNPNASVSRSKSTEQSRNARFNNTHTRSSSGSQTLSAGGQGIWEPWSSIQGLASTLLGNETQRSSGSRANGATKKPLWMKQDKSYGTKVSTQKWGPSHEAPSSAVQEAIEERKAMVQAKKREALLLPSASENRDSLGRYKRRDSDAGASRSTPTDSAEDALVYLHEVQKGDTLAGVIIKYNCQADPFRKINRFWPNDNIQTRTHVLVPLEGCAARGKKVDSPYLTNDLFDSRLDNLTTRTSSTSQGSDSLPPEGLTNSTAPSVFASEPLSLITSSSEEIDFKHDSWVVLPGIKDPVEILRVPRRALGYFPRTRRKSNATTTVASATSTPKTSFDMLRHPPTHAAQVSLSLNASPVRSSRMNARPSLGRQRSSSATRNSFVEALRGPGGVGTLRGLRTEASRPGPAEDTLNRQFAQYLPDLLPPADIPRTGLTLRPSPRATPRPSTDSTRSTRSNSSGLGEVGGAIEGWVRKMAGVKRERGAAIDKMGDLIELETNTELDGMGNGGSSSSRGPEDTSDVSTPTAGRAATSATTSSATTTQEALLNERFPIRGRVRNAYNTSSSSSGKDKGD
ncbi:hypothetical protein PV05_04617 [Exophiala xenobiotica]|uniref:LysM domain-containing protein n=1 Tax=Exophiala xenobiotica TaxID=348802 RepID=A0A0D2EME3_9EURO|nr:uncharacterized protein PV05_04617 [Exophiala xenobiotica]KIW55910.1 hypothetical protein PV05_04617 [Exophiala xenobiotica]